MKLNIKQKHGEILPAFQSKHCQSESEVAQSCSTICNPRTLRYQASLSMGFSRQEYWSGLQFPSPGDLPDTGINTVRVQGNI